MSIIFLIILAIIIIVSGLLLALDSKKNITIKKNSTKTILYFVLVIAVLLACISLLGKPLLKKINVYQEGVLMESEEQCKSDNAPFWCNL